jgi:hypothetical protein
MSRPLPRYLQPPLTHDPLTQLIAQRDARESQAIAAINAGHIPLASPEQGRGIPIIGKGIGGTSPGTDPYLAVQHWPER